MFKAYFDASGKSTRRGMMSIAGFVSDVTKWQKFEVEWARILEREGVSLFHMTDFVSSRGEFAGWKGQTDRRRVFVKDLLECARKYTNKEFGGVIVLRDYERVNRRYQVQEYAGRPYAFCAHYCTRLVRKWQTKNHVKTVEYFFEQGDEYPGDLIRLCKADGIRPTFLPKDQPMFQAADLVAYRTRDAFERARNPNLTTELSWMLADSFSEVWQGPHQAFYGDRARIEQFCLDERIPLREPEQGQPV